MPDGEGLNARVEAIGDQFLLYGVAPPEARRAIFQAAGGAPVEINLIPVTNPDASVIAEFVPDSSSWSLVTYDASGNELERIG